METTMIELSASKLWLVNFYREQLDKFAKVGLGKETENNVKVTKELIEVTKKRLNAIAVVYDGRMTLQAMVLRRLKKEGQLNEHTNGNGAAPTSSSKDIRTNGHERSET